MIDYPSSSSWEIRFPFTVYLPKKGNPMPTGTKIGTLMSMSTTLKQLASQIDLLVEHMVAEQAPAGVDPSPLPGAPAAPAKRGRPAAPKQEVIPEVEKHVEEQKADDKTITPGHPLRAKLQALAKDACTTLPRDKVVATIALFSEGGQGSASVPDAQLAEAIKAIETKVANAKKKTEQAEAPL